MVNKKISNKSWQTDISRLFIELLERNPDARLAILGVGNELAGDDAIGNMVARNLMSLIDHPGQSDRLVILDGGLAPESFIGKLEAFLPDIILILDAADLHAAPGFVKLMGMCQVPGSLPSTHSLSLNVLTHYLRYSVTCDIYFLGIQPDTLEFDTQLSPIARETVKEITQFLHRLIEKPGFYREDMISSMLQNNNQYVELERNRKWLKY